MNVLKFDRTLERMPNPRVGTAAATPFVKWPGGKRTPIPDIARHFPDRAVNYREPFVGGDAVFFAFSNRIEHAVLSDANEELIIAYRHRPDGCGCVDRPAARS